MVARESLKAAKLTGVVVPEFCSLQAKYLLVKFVKTNAPIYVPAIPTKDKAARIFYTFTSNGKYKYVGPQNQRRHAKLHKDSIKRLVSELVVNVTNQGFWAENHNTDLDYLLIVVGLLDEALYMQLKLKDDVFVQGLNVGPSNSDLKLFKKTIESNDNAITRILFALFDLQKQNELFLENAHSDLGVLEKLYSMAVKIFHVSGDQKLALSDWLLDCKKLLDEKSFLTSKEYFIKAANESVLKKDRYILSPEPLKEQAISEDLLAFLIEAKKTILSENPNKSKSVPKLKQTPGIFKYPSDFTFPKAEKMNVEHVDAPVDKLTEMVREIERFMTAGKSLPHELLMQMIDGYWKLDSSSKTVIPVRENSSLKLPIIPTGYIPKSFFDALEKDKNAIEKKPMAARLVEPKVVKNVDLNDLADKFRYELTFEIRVNILNQVIADVAAGFLSSKEIILDKTRLSPFVVLALNKITSKTANKVIYDDLDFITKQKIGVIVLEELNKNGDLNRRIRIELIFFIRSFLKTAYICSYPILLKEELRNIRVILKDMSNDITDIASSLKKEVDSEIPEINALPINSFGKFLPPIVDDGHSGNVGDHADPTKILIKDQQETEDMYDLKAPYKNVGDLGDFRASTKNQLEDVFDVINSSQKISFGFNYSLSETVFSQSNSGLSDKERLQLWNNTITEIKNYFQNSDFYDKNVDFNDKVVTTMPLRIARLSKLQQKVIEVYVNGVRSFLTTNMKMDIAFIIAYDTDAHIMRMLLEFGQTRRYTLKSLFVISETAIVACFLAHNLFSKMASRDLFDTNLMEKNLSSVRMVIKLLRYLKRLLLCEAKFMRLVKIDESDIDVRLPYGTFGIFYDMLRVSLNKIDISKDEMSLKEIANDIKADQRAIPFVFGWLGSVDYEYFDLDNQMYASGKPEIFHHGEQYVSCFINPSDHFQSRTKQKFGDITEPRGILSTLLGFSIF